MSQLEKTWLWYNDMAVHHWATDKVAFVAHIKLYNRKYHERCIILCRDLGYKLEE